MKNNKVSVIGSMNYDIMMNVGKMPIIGETNTASKLEFHIGGKGLNQAYQVAKLGLKVNFFGMLGNDSFADYIIDNSKNPNLDIKNVERVDVITGLGIVNILDDGDVYANIFPGANFEVDIDYINRMSDYIFEADYIVLQLEIPTETVEYVIEEAYKRGKKVIFNAAPAKEISSEALKKVHTFIVNETEAEFYFGDKFDSIENAIERGKKLYDKVGENLIITLGGQGSLIFSGDKYEHIKPYKVDKVVDSTGAGDSYTGGLVFGLNRGYNIFQACEFASIVASKTITRVGAQSAMPYLGDIEYDSEIEKRQNTRRG